MPALHVPSSEGHHRDGPVMGLAVPPSWPQSATRAAAAQAAAAAQPVPASPLPRTIGPDDPWPWQPVRPDPLLPPHGYYLPYWELCVEPKGCEALCDLAVSLPCTRRFYQWQYGDWRELGYSRVQHPVPKDLVEQQWRWRQRELAARKAERAEQLRRQAARNAGAGAAVDKADGGPARLAEAPASSAAAPPRPFAGLAVKPPAAPPLGQQVVVGYEIVEPEGVCCWGDRLSTRGWVWVSILLIFWPLAFIPCLILSCHEPFQRPVYGDPPTAPPV